MRKYCKHSLICATAKFLVPGPGHTHYIVHTIQFVSSLSQSFFFFCNITIILFFLCYYSLFFLFFSFLSYTIFAIPSFLQIYIYICVSCVYWWMLVKMVVGSGYMQWLDILPGFNVHCLYALYIYRCI